MTHTEYINFIKQLEIEISLLPLPLGIKELIIDAVRTQQERSDEEIKMGLDEQSENETVAIITSNPKLHALYFDRLDVQALHDSAEDIPFKYKSRYLTYETCLYHLLAFILNHILEQLVCDGLCNRVQLAPLVILLLQKSEKVAIYGNGFIPCDNFSNMCIRQYAKQLSTQYSIDPCPIYSTEAEISKDFAAGSHMILQRVVSNLNIVDENKLEWEQIDEFRKDKESRLSYIHFLNYLRERWDIYDTDLFIYEIEKSYYEYKKALKKHGMTTRIGFLKDLFSTEVVLPTAISSVASHIINPALMPFITGTFFAGTIAFKILQYKADVKFEKPDSSIAWLIGLEDNLK